MVEDELRCCFLEESGVIAGGFGLVPFPMEVFIDSKFHLTRSSIERTCESFLYWNWIGGSLRPTSIIYLSSCCIFDFTADGVLIKFSGPRRILYIVSPKSEQDDYTETPFGDDVG